MTNELPDGADLRDAAAGIQPDVVELRRAIHREPELGLELPRTQTKVLEAITRLGLGEQYPDAQFVITGVLGPESNAHGPNEFLDLPTARRVSACMAHVLDAHAPGNHRTPLRRPHSYLVPPSRSTSSHRRPAKGARSPGTYVTWCSVPV